MSDKFEVAYADLSEAVNVMPVADSHEQLMPESMRVAQKIDFFTITMSQYASSDLVSAGMPKQQMEQLRNPEIAFHEKVSIFMPYWEKANNTTYCRVLKIAAKDLYGIDEINAQTLPELNDKMIEANTPGLYKSILEEKCNIRYCIWDQSWVDMPEKSDFFRPALQLDNIVFINSSEDISALEKEFDTSITNPGSLEEIMEICITNHKSCGLRALKSRLVYERGLDYLPVSKSEATLSMDRILRNRFTDSDAKVLQDYLMYSVAQKAYWHDITFKIQTGLMDGYGNHIRNANPALLSDLISNNPYTRFALTQGSYPYGGEWSSLGKMFHNVYLDMCLLHVISPVYVLRHLAEWLETVPLNKILGFGGSYYFPEGVYGHLQIAKENIVTILASMVADDRLSVEEAKHYATMMLHDNVENLFM